MSSDVVFIIVLENVICKYIFSVVLVKHILVQFMIELVAMSLFYSDVL